MGKRQEFKFPKTTIERLSYYSRVLEDFVKRGTDTVSSEVLGHRLNIKPSQVRKDLSYFGDFGKRGMGYDVKYLLKELRYILGLDRKWGVIVVGGGHLGSSMTNYPGFMKRGFVIEGIFDTDKNKVGTAINGVPVLHTSKMGTFIREKGPEMAIIAVPDNAAQSVADALCAEGIKAIMNFAPVHLSVPPDVRLLDVDLTTKLEILSYYMSFSKDKLWKVFS